MNAGTKSLIRHILTALGVLLAAVGMADASDVFNTLLVDLDGIWDAILVITGLVTTGVEFFTKREEVEAVEEKDRFIPVITIFKKVCGILLQTFSI